MRRAALCALTFLAACGGGDGSPDAPATGPITAQIRHYDYRFDIETRVAHSTVSAIVDTPGDCLTLPFRAEAFDATTAKIDGVAAVTASATASAVTICGSGYSANQAITVEADMTIPLQTLSTSQVGYSITKDAQQNAFYYLVSWVGGCDRFGPCDNRPDQFATYTFHVTHPAALMVRCPGIIADVSATETQCDFTPPGGPTYSTFGVAAYPLAAWTQTDQGMWGSVHVTLYDRAQTGIAAAIDNTYHAGFVAWMEATFGPYPFGSDLRVLTAPTYWSGFEHPGNIVLDDGLAHEFMPSYLKPVEHVLDHEIAHMWAGDQTTLADTYDFVWKESMAEYLSYSYETTADIPAGDKTVHAWKGFSSSAAFFPVPDEKPALFDYYGDVYGPGPMVLFRQLEVLSSHAQVIDAIKSVLGSPHALSVDMLLSALHDKTGLDLTAYAAAWIHGTGVPAWPKIMLTFTPAAGTSTLVVHQTTAPERRCKFHVALDGAVAGQRQLVEVDTFHNGIDQSLPVPTPAFTVTATVLDPAAECLVYPATFTSAHERAHPWRSDRGAAADASGR